MKLFSRKRKADTPGPDKPKYTWEELKLGIGLFDKDTDGLTVYGTAIAIADLIDAAPSDQQMALCNEITQDIQQEFPDIVSEHLLGALLDQQRIRHRQEITGEKQNTRLATPEEIQQTRDRIGKIG